MNAVDRFVPKIFNRLDIILVRMFQVVRKSRFLYEGHLKNDVRSFTSESFCDDFGIIITTFEARLFSYGLPLIAEIRKYTEIDIFIVINGNYETNNHNNNLKEFLASISQFINIYPIAFANLRGCATLWNSGIELSDYTNYLILNDDIEIVGSNLLDEIADLRIKLLNSGLVTINGTFSHFAISEKCIERVGLFDEHFLGFGHEDVDYMYRYWIEYGARHLDHKSISFFNLTDGSRDNSIARQESTSKYSKFNLNMIQALYKEDRDNGVTAAFDRPMSRVSDFVNPRPLSYFRKEHYGELTD